jgi:hypothetical protein
VTPHPDRRRNVIWITAPKRHPGSEILGDERVICELHGAPDHSDAETLQANARLIAGAPELLEACKAALSEYEPVTLGTFHGREIKGQTAMNVPSLLRAPIAKAEGNT